MRSSRSIPSTTRPSSKSTCKAVPLPPPDHSRRSFFAVPVQSQGLLRSFLCYFVACRFTFKVKNLQKQKQFLVFPARRQKNFSRAAEVRLQAARRPGGSQAVQGNGSNPFSYPVLFKDCVSNHCKRRTVLIRHPAVRIRPSRQKITKRRPKDPSAGSDVDALSRKGRPK